MKVICKYWKNSNTGEVLKSQEFTETTITGIPIYFYDKNGIKKGENLDLTVFIETKLKTFLKAKTS
jgi:hypothetical protein